MRNLHIVKNTKDNKKGWNVIDGKILIGWGLTKRLAIIIAASEGSVANPVSVKIHLASNGRIAEERTYPRSADPKKSKG